MVSVIVPVYNTEKYLRRCMDALVGQTLDHDLLEIVVVNDGSTDGSLKILNEYSEKYPHIVKIFSKENGGQASARNLGIEKASGEYVGFADSDDHVDTTMFEKLYKAATDNDADIVECHYHSMLELTEDGPDGFPLYKEIGTRGTIKSHSDSRELFFDPQVSPWNKLYKKKILIDNSIRFPEGMIYEDTAFYVKVLPYIKKQIYVDEKLVYYSVRKNSTMTSNQGKRVGDILLVIDDILNYYKDNDLYNSYKDELEYFCVKILFCSNFSRIGRVESNDLRKELLKKSFDYARSIFPDYRQNKYFTGKIGVYIKSVNRLNYGIYSKILSKVMIG